jgi:hypothetical protein
LPIVPILVEEAVLRRIWEVRPLLKLKQEVNPELARASASDTTASLGLAQRVYTLGLDSLTSRRKDAGAVATGLRVYETVDGVPQAYYDVDDDQQGTIRQMSASPTHLEPFARALEGAVAQAEGSEQSCELRLYRVPALNFEALWLSYEGGKGDQLVPLTAVGPLPTGEPVPFAEALTAVREAARPLVDMDDTMGS